MFAVRMVALDRTYRFDFAEECGEWREDEVAFEQQRSNAERAVSAGEPGTRGVPLRGACGEADGTCAAEAETRKHRAAGTVWADAALLPALHVQVGDVIDLGDKRFTISRLVTLEPDRGLSFVNLAPRVLMRLADLAATNLIQNGSRESTRLLLR